MSGRRLFPQVLGPPEVPKGAALAPPAGVLIVDDEPPVRRLLEVSLRQQGFTVWSAAGGEEAVALYGRLAGEIGLVLLDVRMPFLDGPHTLAALQRINPVVRCCFMSGAPGQYTAENLLEQGAVHLFHKPFALSEVVARIRQLLATVPAAG
jgi:DNA-binding response OmpR family regulator